MTELICIVCPRGCRLKVDEARDFAVSGNHCERGRDYGQSELKNPTRTLTTTVKLLGRGLKRCPVRTSVPIPKARLLEAMAVIDRAALSAPVKTGQIVIENLLGTGADVIATRSVD